MAAREELTLGNRRAERCGESEASLGKFVENDFLYATNHPDKP